MNIPPTPYPPHLHPLPPPTSLYILYLSSPVLPPPPPPSTTRTSFHVKLELTINGSYFRKIQVKAVHKLGSNYLGTSFPQSMSCGNCWGGDGRPHWSSILSFSPVLGLTTWTMPRLCLIHLPASKQAAICASCIQGSYCPTSKLLAVKGWLSIDILLHILPRVTNVI